MVAKSFPMNLPSPSSSPSRGEKGVVPAKAGSGGEGERLWFWSCVVAAELPDADILFYPLQLANHPFFYHRSFTHSFLGAIFLGLIFSAFLYRWQAPHLPPLPQGEKKASSPPRRGGRVRGQRGYFLRCWGVLSLSFCTHVIGDWLTSYGTPIFSPFSFKLYSLDILSNLTLFPMAIFALSILLFRYDSSAVKGKDKADGKRWILSGWVIFFLFLGMSAFFQKKSFAISGENTIASLPDLFFPVKWHTIKKNAETLFYETNSVNVLTGKMAPIGKYPALNRFRYSEIESIWDHPRVKRYLHFNRWPVMRREEENSENFIVIGNLLFRGLTPGRLTRALKIVLDEQNKVQSFERTIFQPE